jgi:hypothetical protein
MKDNANAGEIFATSVESNSSRSGGQTRKKASPAILFCGTGPIERESAELARLSPITKTCCAGTSMGP